MRTTLTSGAWVEHRPIQDLKRKDKQLLAGFKRPNLQGALTPDGKVDMDAVLAGMDVLSYVADGEDFCWALVLTAWSYDLPLPAVHEGELLNGASIGELPLEDGEELEALFAPYQDKLRRQPDPKGAQSATTSNSNGSSPVSAAPPSPTA